MLKNYLVLSLIVLFLFPSGMTSQEIQIFQVEDFDLKGKVKSCLVSTNYGKEEYDFNEDGLLSKSVTRYNDTDYDIVYYKYSQGMLLEKRLENYREGVFDTATSMASIYTIDTLLNLKITEKIVTYNKEFLDQYEYFYKSDSIFKITHSNNEGIDETNITYTDLKGEQTKTYTINGIIQQSIRTSFKKEQDSIIEKNILHKKFLDGKPYSASEEIFDGENRLLSKTKFFHNPKSNQFVIEEIVAYQYDASGILLKTKSDRGSDIEEKEYVYQFDASNNWIKEIITPENAYKTRKISYYELDEVEQEE